MSISSGVKIYPRTSCFHVLTTSPRLPDSDRPTNEFVLCDCFILHMCASFSRFSPVWNRRRWEESRGSLVKAQASARVDVPTALFFSAVRTKESNTCASFCANAWLCACQATDRDLERVSAVKIMNAWMCALLTTDCDLDSSSATKKVSAWICALLTTDHDLASIIPDKKRKPCNLRVFMRTLCFFFGINKSRNFFCFFLLTEIVFELIDDFACNHFRGNGTCARRKLGFLEARVTWTSAQSTRAKVSPKERSTARARARATRAKAKGNEKVVSQGTTRMRSQTASVLFVANLVISPKIVTTAFVQ